MKADQSIGEATKKSERVEMPPVAAVCSVTAWLSVAIGGIALVGGLIDAGKPMSGGEVTTGMALLVSSVLWFAIARVITLLAQIAHNTRAPGTEGKSS